jgi:type IV pilus assembly protein PilO
MAIDIKGLKLDALIKLPLSKKILVVGGINALFIVVLYQFLLGPKLTELSELRNNLESLNALMEENRRIAADIPRFESEKAALEEQFKKALEQLPNEKEIPDLIDSISDAAKKSGLKILLFQPRGEILKGFYADVPVDMEVEGSFEAIYLFCEKISKLSRIVNIEGITLSSAVKEPALSPAVRAKFTALTFRFVSEEEAAKMAAPKK